MDLEKLFSFLPAMFNYDERKVALYDEGGLMISTASVLDGQKPFETAVIHSDYNDGCHVIVEMYDTEAQAIIGHENWVKIMTTEPLPTYLRDCGNALCSQIIETLFNDRSMIFPRCKEEE